MVVIDFKSRWLTTLCEEDVNLVLGQVIYGVITNSVMRQYGRLLEFFFRLDDSAVRPMNDKLKYVDDLFEECHRNTVNLRDSLSAYRNTDFQIDDVSYNAEGQYVTFTLAEQQPFDNIRRSVHLPEIDRKPFNNGRSLLRRR